MMVGHRAALTRPKKLDMFLLLHEEKFVRGAMVPAEERSSGLKTKAHRPTIDLMQVREMASLGLTHAEMCKVIGCSTSHFTALLDHKPALAIAIEQGEGSLRQSLRKAQIQTAIEDRNPSMLIWLGKQYLGQVDKREIESKGEINIMVQRAQEELKSIPREQLLEAQRLLSMKVVENDPTTD